MRVLTVNAGSHSLHLVYVEDGNQAQRLDSVEPPGSGAARDAVARFLADQRSPDAVGHRLVHGGEAVRRSSVVDDRLRGRLDSAGALAPLHVPPALDLLDTLRARLPRVPHVVCPDTAFHADLPEVAATFPLPAAWRQRWGLRRYGFHGLSYAWALRRAAALMDRPVEQLRVVMAHLGGGCSVCAVRAGRSLDTSMGFTPLDGVPMGTRSGAVDPGLLLWLLGTEPDGGARLSVAELADGLNHRSGLLGLSGGRSNDTRDLVDAAGTDPAAALALRVFAFRVAREIAAVAASLDRLDALVFTGEIGWDQAEVRQAVCAGLTLLGVPSPQRGNRDDDGPVSPAGAAVAVLVVEPREELQLAAETVAALEAGKP
ncbi:acetate/propionate family kinase [Rugosimonospora acidiphila]|uniref:Acetate kinase n=1 Tax=Rugosimonospora acidiphila TaxID=556531 RepID=A0ABP9STE0_9ACTN